ncbi:histidinol-phosphate transaminase [Halomonas urumqiensis]|uniref:Histidinol-phosphate aminotransferase n=1 Tax=Halomonas urumqiensis TaxID=1684789 RepID=A0A2N7UL83_9GAMM|nr:histidinol-phosphate transaminase [Halomonas urumqiensis]PMR81205.1 histidinol-phosphate transaminase [Halomonas urumqiensis]PTB01784.1 histidinol-phosphate transaminase [Halomonas urumqiensis]GHE22111.1 histidinol-phosphate aminotransferase [Halomonas urumqiensis]
MSKFWSPRVRELTPYIPGEQPRERLIKLNTNENPYPPAPGVGAVLREFPTDHLRLYPDPGSLALREALATVLDVPASHVFVGNGSDEVLALAFQAFFCQPKSLATPEISYSFYPVYCNMYGIERKAYPLDDQWRVDLGAFEAESGGIIFANPNAPTGHGHGRDAIAALLEKVTDRVVLIDEAYVDFGGESAVPLTDKYSNLLVTGTFSKSRSLAGLRLGYAVGSPELIEGLTRVKDSFNSYPVDALASAVAIASLADQEHFDATRGAVIATRERTRTRLEALGFKVLPSQTNFVLATHPTHDAAQIFVGLRERGILVRHFNTDALRDYLRISIGTDDEMDSLIEVLEALCG